MNKPMMKAAMAISHGRMAPCFAGVELWIVDFNSSTHIEGDVDTNDREVLSTQGWHPLGWGRELMRHDVGLLLCAGIDQSTWASVQGHGIQVVPNAMGDAGSVLAAWRLGDVTPPRHWPAYPDSYDCLQARKFSRAGGRRRFHGGR